MWHSGSEQQCELIAASAIAGISDSFVFDSLTLTRLAGPENSFEY